MSRRPLVGLFVLVIVAAGVAVASIAGGGATTAGAHGDHGGGPATPTDGAGEQDCSFPVAVTDATGQRVTVGERPERIVALQPSVAQTLWEIGARDRVVGMPVNEYTTYLNGSNGRTNVVQADDFNTDVETVVSLEPDLVLAPNVVPNETVGQLRNLGLTVYRFGYGRSLDDIYQKTNRTGRLVGECGNATTVVTAMQTRVDRIQRAVAGRDRPRILYGTGQYTAGNGTFVHDAIRIAGGRNIAAEAGIQGYQTISDEVVVERDPEWIAVTDDGSRPLVPRRAPYANTTALRKNQTVVLDSNLLSQPAPRVVVPVTRLAKRLHPEAASMVSGTWAPRRSTTEDSASTTTGPVNGHSASRVVGEDVDTPAKETSASGSLSTGIAMLALLVVGRRYQQRGQ